MFDKEEKTMGEKFSVGFLNRANGKCRWQALRHNSVTLPSVIGEFMEEEDAYLFIQALGERGRMATPPAPQKSAMGEALFCVKELERIVALIDLKSVLTNRLHNLTDNLELAGASEIQEVANLIVMADSIRKYIEKLPKEGA